MAHKYVYLFSEGNGSMRELLGGKGANLAEMTSLGMPVPQGFTITTEACTNYYATDRQISPESRNRFLHTWKSWKKSQAKNLVILKTHCCVQ